MNLNAGLFAVLVICALATVTAQHYTRKSFTALQQAKAEAERLDIEWGKLQLEQASLAVPGRVERLAARQWQMQFPSVGQTRFVRSEGRS